MIQLKAIATCTHCKSTRSFNVTLSATAQGSEVEIGLSPEAPPRWHVTYDFLSGEVTSTRCPKCQKGEAWW